MRVGRVPTEPQAPNAGLGGAFSGNFPAGNHDFDGPIPLDVGMSCSWSTAASPMCSPRPEAGPRTATDSSGTPPTAA